MLVAVRRLGPEPPREAAARRSEIAGPGDVAPGRASRPAGVTRPDGQLARFRLWAEPGDEGLVAVGYTPADVATAAKLPRLQALSTATVPGR
jgi:hypothetical protein